MKLCPASHHRKKKMLQDKMSSLFSGTRAAIDMKASVSSITK